MKKGQDGNDYRWFEKPKGARNEPLDVRVYAMAAMTIGRPNLAALSRKAKSETASESPKPKQRRRGPRPPRNWILGSG